MTVREAIARADEIQPNAFSENMKTAWINEVEGQVQTDIHRILPEDCVAYTYAADADKTLLVLPPHDKLYPLYLGAMIDYANGEISRYQNSAGMFNAAWDEFYKWYLRHNLREQAQVRRDA